MKTRTTEQLVPHTVDGKTRMVPIKVPAVAPPRDWDHLVLNGVTGIAAVVLTASVVWSTASIGDLLARTVVEPAAYGAAVVFDLAWIACMAVEWLARYDEDRAALPRKAGNVALAVAMLAIGAHGKLTGYWEIGVVGALVSAVAKGLWTVVLRHQTPPLDERTRAWIHAELAEAGASLALVPVRRRVQRAHGLVSAERTALGGPDQDQSGPDPRSGSASPLPTLSGPMTIKDAVQTAKTCGITDPDAVLRYVRQVADANAKPDTVGRYLRGA